MQLRSGRSASDLPAGPRLWLLRHAKSSWTSDAARDAHRPLAERGRRDARRLGRWLAARALAPEAIWCSPALRARETLELCRESWTVEEARIQAREALYHAPLRSLRRQLQAAPAATGSLLLVGHNPGLEDLLGFLCGPALPRTARGKLFTTANLAAIRLERPWARLARGCGQLELLLRPGDLAAAPWRIPAGRRDPCPVQGVPGCRRAPARAACSTSRAGLKQPSPWAPAPKC